MAHFQDLPPDSIRIVEDAVVSTSKEKISQYPLGAEYMKLNIGAIDSRLRESFLDVIRMRRVLRRNAILPNSAIPQRHCSAMAARLLP